MLKETATVVAVEGDYAQVQCISKSACSHCHAASSCGNSSVAKAFGPRQHKFSVRLIEPVTPGQQIHVGLPAKSLIRSALLVYLVPLILMLVGAVVASQMTGSDTGALVGVVAGGTLGFGLARFAARRMDSRSQYQPIMLSRADSDECD
jgi:sigma-E factor negative regulatory protein RseC